VAPCAITVVKTDAFIKSVSCGRILSIILVYFGDHGDTFLILEYIVVEIVIVIVGAIVGAIVIGLPWTTPG